MVTLTVVIVKRRLRKRQNSEVQTGSPFSLAELDEMYRKGLISKEEFAALRKKMIMEITGEGGGKTKSSQPR